MPMKSVPRIAAIQPSVIAALRDSGGRKAGMPLEIASVPVMAVQPEENARRTRNHTSGSVAATGGGAAGGSEPVSSRQAPTTISSRKLAMKTYVGTAKMRPDSRTPRMLARAMAATHTIPIATLCVDHSGTAEVIAATPAATDTATVST